MDDNPFIVFARWFAIAGTSGMKEPTAMDLATVGKSGAPSLRVVLLKNWNEQGFVFYTNSNSRKGRELGENPQAALNFYWMELQRQIRIEGEVEIVTGKEADDYFNSRHVERRLGAWASKQSEPLSSRDELVKAIEEVRKKYGEKPPRPEFWHGYRLTPKRFEFWQEGEHRLHQRDVYERKGNSWQHYLIYP